MNLENSHNNPPQESRKSFGAALIWLAVYTLLVFGLATLFYKLLLNKMWLVPLLAEVALIRNAWTTGPFWKGLLARFVGLTIGNALTHFLYVIPVIYEGDAPWSEEALWGYIIVTVQTAVAAGAYAAIRRLLGRKRVGTSR